MLVSEINAEIGNYAEIINTMSNLSIYYKRENNLTTLVHIICRNSNVLLCMKFTLQIKIIALSLIFMTNIFLVLQMPTGSDNPAKNT